jgi:hypothetical protein
MSSGYGGGGAKLVREVIAKSLYSSQGYFTLQDVINYTSARLDFTRLRGEDAYRKCIDAAYKRKRGAWLTPVELFAPLYSQAVAEYILSEHKKNAGSSPLVLYEIGAGSGTNALEILNHIKLVTPHVYAQATYTTVEISPRLQEIQRHRVCSCHANARVVGADATLWTAKDERPCFVLGFEVLDNLPHDKIQLIKSPGGEVQLHETVVSCNEESGELMEQTRAVEDNIIKNLLEACPDYASRLSPPPSPSVFHHLKAFVGATPEHSASFIPTGAYELFCRLRDNVPNHRLLLADFDRFPPPILSPNSNASCRDLIAFNAPLVSALVPTSDGMADMPTYLVKEGSADIFFPSDFALLKKVYCWVSGRDAEHMSQSDFLRPFVDKAAATTRSGYCPILDDFSNCRVLVS